MDDARIVKAETTVDKQRAEIERRLASLAEQSTQVEAEIEAFIELLRECGEGNLQRRIDINRDRITLVQSQLKWAVMVLSALLAATSQTPNL